MKLPHHLARLGVHVLATCLLGTGWAAAGEPAALFERQADRIVVPASSPLRKQLIVEAVGSHDTPNRISIPASVEADPSRVVAVLPPLTGRLVALKVGLGSPVRKGQLLALISSGDLAQAQADATRAADALALANRVLERSRGVMAVGANATKDFEAAESAQTQALAEDRRARQRLQTLTGGAGSDASQHLLAVTAPASGTVASLNVGAGAYLNDPTAPLMTIVNLDHVWVTAQVPEDRLNGIAAGVAADVTLAAYPGQPMHGRVGFVSPQLESDTRRAKVRITFGNADGRLKPNMFASVQFTIPQTAAVTVPTSALLMNNDSTTVFVEVAPWTFVRRVVELGTEDHETVRISAGLKPGEHIITRGGVLLND